MNAARATVVEILDVIVAMLLAHACLIYQASQNETKMVLDVMIFGVDRDQVVTRVDHDQVETFDASVVGLVGRACLLHRSRWSRWL